MDKVLLINADDPEEVRVALLEDGRLEEIYIEAGSDPTGKGNVYVGRVQNVEKGIGACFVDLGGNVTGFLHAGDIAERPGTAPEAEGWKIQDLVKPGDPLLVQITRGPVGHKGPALTTRISLPGRYVVLLANSRRGGVSRRIDTGEERDRMRALLSGLELPAGMAVILRTASIGRSIAEVQADLSFLLELWNGFKDRLKDGGGPRLVHEESDLVSRAVRDILPPDAARIVTDLEETSVRLREYLDRTAPKPAAPAPDAASSPSVPTDEAVGATTPPRPGAPDDAAPTSVDAGAAADSGRERDDREDGGHEPGRDEGRHGDDARNEGVVEAGAFAETEPDDDEGDDDGIDTAPASRPAPRDAVAGRAPDLEGGGHVVGSDAVAAPVDTPPPGVALVDGAESVFTGEPPRVRTEPGAASGEPAPVAAAEGARPPGQGGEGGGRRGRGRRRRRGGRRERPEPVPPPPVVVELHRAPTPLFHAYGIEAQIEDAFRRSVRLPSGGSIVIDPTEALVAIDVNSGRLTEEEDIEATALKTDLEAVPEVARQLRLRDLGGVIVIDFIDLKESSHVRQVENALRQALARDRARIRMGRMGPFGCLELTRQRIRPALASVTHVACPTCNGLGRRRHPLGLALRLLRELRARAARSRGHGGMEVKLPALVLDALRRKKGPALAELEAALSGPLRLQADPAIPYGSWSIKGIPVKGAAVSGRPAEPVGPDADEFVDGPGSA